MAGRLSTMENSKVWNRRRGDAPENAIYVGRPSKWGNPFEVGVYGSRAACVCEYRKYITVKYTKAQIVAELRGKHLVCWCAPLPCHADVLLEIANGDK